MCWLVGRWATGKNQQLVVRVEEAERHSDTIRDECGPHLDSDSPTLSLISVSTCRSWTEVLSPVTRLKFHILQKLNLSTGQWTVLLLLKRKFNIIFGSKHIYQISSSMECFLVYKIQLQLKNLLTISIWQNQYVPQRNRCWIEGLYIFFKDLQKCPFQKRILTRALQEHFLPVICDF